MGPRVLINGTWYKRHYKYALSGFDSYYKKKYYGVVPKLKSAVSLFWLNINGLVWGHGEKPGRLLLSSVVLLCMLALTNFWSVMPTVGWAESANGLKPLARVRV
jgi:hypothetical protein